MKFEDEWHENNRSTAHLSAIAENLSELRQLRIEEWKRVHITIQGKGRGGGEGRLK